MEDKRLLYVRGGLAFLLVFICSLMLFVPVTDTAAGVQEMFVLLTGIAVRDFFSAVSNEKKMEQLKQAYDPTPPPPSFNEE